MAYFRVLLEGSDIDVAVGDSRARGFFVTRFIRSSTEASASAEAIRVVAAEWSSGLLQVHNATPTITVTAVGRIGMLSGVFARQPGYAFYESK